MEETDYSKEKLLEKQDCTMSEERISDDKEKIWLVH